MTGRTTIIVNVASGRGLGARLLPRVRAAFEHIGVRDIRLTRGPRDEVTLTEHAISEGSTTVVAVGGDGTWSNVANAILASGADCRLAAISAGTGNDFVKSIGAPAGDLARMAHLVAEGAERRIDVGRVGDRWFVNALGFGFDVAVIEHSARVRWFGGRLLYLYSALHELFGYRGISVDVCDSSGQAAPGKKMMVVIANGRYFGGAFTIAPDATIDDGRLDVVTISDVPPSRRLPLLGSAARGTHVNRPEVSVDKAASVTLRFDQPPAWDRDGEYERADASMIEVTCAPKALRVVTA